jgi:choline dehydrogenase-like flavoprotein
LSVHPTVKVIAFFDRPVNDPGDVAVHQVKEFAPELSFGGSASRPGLVALALADDWAAMGDRVADWERASVYYAAIQSEGRGRVQAVPGVAEPLVTYRLTGTDRRRLASGLCRLTHLLLGAGAETVLASAKGVAPVRCEADVADLADAFSTTRASVMTVHLCSTVPLGERDDCPADSHGRLKAADNVYVNDASLLPEAPGVNPQGTIMALAHRDVARFLDREG